MNGDAVADSSLAGSRPPVLTGPFLRLCAVTFVTFIAAFQLFPTIPFRIMELGGTATQAGLFLTVYTWASAVSAPWMGGLADRFGRRRLLVTASLAFVLFSVAYGFIEALPGILAVSVVHGVLWSGVLSASGAMITDVIPLERRTEGIAYWGMAPTAAIAVAPAIGLAVYDVSWRALTWEIALLSAVVAGLALSVPETPRSAHTIEGPMVDWRVMAASAAIFVLAFGYGGVTSYVAVLCDQRGIEPRSLFFTVFASTVLLARVVIAPRADRIGPMRLFYPSVALIPPALVVLAGAETATGITVSALLFGLGFGSAYPAFLAWIMSRTDPTRRAATFGSTLFVMDTAIGAGSLAVGWMAGALSYRAAFVTGAILATLCIPVFLATRSLLPPFTSDSA